MVITGNRQTERLVRKAVLAAGYPEAVISVERLSFSAYVEPVFGIGREIGLGTVTDPNFEQGGKPGDSARQYLKPGDPYYEHADMLYAWKIARYCGREPFCMEVGDPKDIDEELYNNEK